MKSTPEGLAIRAAREAVHDAEHTLAGVVLASTEAQREAAVEAKALLVVAISKLDEVAS